ncbi:YchJ family protein [Demequina lignilytica]|uniref:UPF0225 protein QQ002_07590 n=1 Tax=Demequina lignilytica TaxID=3051663 RepID=A0AB35MI39_9MICO|nr:YchJ family metal-binding protein [Demequina sp. SYSU T0a273]MDN4483397.1 YchJ family metal-binding protein [Demequina sp. SYSU T0a273]
MALCPCGSGDAFPDCCRPYLRGEAAAPTAEALMRSRYTAFVRGDAGYLMRTWHPRTCPATLDVEETDWRGLEVLATEAGGAADSVGTVTFVAHYATGVISTGTMRERSSFVREDGRWLYVEAIDE